MSVSTHQLFQGRMSVFCSTRRQHQLGSPQAHPCCRITSLQSMPSSSLATCSAHVGAICARREMRVLLRAALADGTWTGKQATRGDAGSTDVSRSTAATPCCPSRCILRWQQATHYAARTAPQWLCCENLNPAPACRTQRRLKCTRHFKHLQQLYVGTRKRAVAMKCPATSTRAQIRSHHGSRPLTRTLKGPI
jgi:hypothetical protein